MKAYKDIQLKVGKNYAIGLPLGESYKKKTPGTIKTTGEILLLVGGFVTLAVASFSPPAWVIYAGGAATLAGRFIVKCFSNNNN